MLIRTNHTTLVTVTYGSRWHLLRRALTSARIEGVAHAIVVANGAQEDIKGLAFQEFGTFTTVVTLPNNLGSAGGFKQGISTAMAIGTSYILLLDDDNELQPGCLSALTAAYQDRVRSVRPEDLSVLAFRPDHQADIANGATASRVNPRPSSFFGFHVLDIPYKFWRRFHIKKTVIPGQKQETFCLDVAPYSGMLFHTKVIQAHGLPNESMVLYADDTEFSYRLTAAGGEIRLVTAAQIKDLDTSWNVKSRFSSSFDQWLSGGNDFRAFYAARNQAYFECVYRKGSGVIRFINRSVYLALLWLRALQTGRRQRHTLLLDAIKNGESSRLGLDPRFPI